MPHSPGDNRDRAPATGPRGGTSTVNSSGDLVRKAFWIDREVDELRLLAHTPGWSREAHLLAEKVEKAVNAWPETN